VPSSPLSGPTNPSAPPGGAPPGSPPGGSSLLDGAKTIGGIGSAIAPVLGGPGGGGNGGDMTNSRDLPDWLKPYVAHEGGLVPMTHGLLQRQAPEAERNGALLQGMGTNLLNFQPAQNGFAQFQNRRF
jgi:hypothetical protein